MHKSKFETLLQINKINETQRRNNIYDIIMHQTFLMQLEELPSRTHVRLTTTS